MKSCIYFILVFGICYQSFSQEVDSKTDSITSKGDNILELPVSSYLIAGSSETFDEAKNLANQLFGEGFKETIVGYSSSRELYYTAVYRSTEIDDVTDKQHGISDKLKNTWILIVVD